MRPVDLQGTPSGTTEQKLRWIIDAVRDLAGASRDNDPVDIASNFQLPATFNVLRTIPASPTLTDLRDLFSTFISDLAKGGSVRTG